MRAETGLRRVLYAVIALALVVRLAGVSGQGYPFTFWNDEDGNVKRSVRFFDPEKRRLDLNPHWFNKPAFGYYINFGAYGFYYLCGRYVTGEFSSPSEFGRSFINDQGPFLVIGRALQSIFGALAVWVLYRHARRARDPLIGVVAAMILAFSVGHVTWSQVVKKDVLTSLLTAISMCFVHKIMVKGRLRDYVLAGAFAGLGVGTKYYPITLVGPILLAFWFDPQARSEGLIRRWRRPLVAGAALIAAFFIASPYNFLDPTWSRQGLAGILSHVSAMLGFGAGDVDPNRDTVMRQVGRGALVFMGFREGDWGFTVPHTIAMLVGVVVWWRGTSRRFLAPALLLIVSQFMILAVALELDAHKNHFIMIFPQAALFAAVGYVAIVRRVLPRIAARPLLVVAAVGLLVFLPCPAFAGYETLRRVEDCRSGYSNVSVFAWIQANVPAGATVLNDHDVMPIVPSDERLEWITDRIERALAQSNARLDVSKDPGEIGYHEQRRTRYSAYRLQYKLTREAAGTYRWRRYDVISLLKPWQTEDVLKLEEKRYGYNDLWDYQPLSVPPDVADTPECYRCSPSILEEQSRSRSPILEGRPAEYLVSSEKSYTNYRTEKHRRIYPHWARFYDDLAAHYDCWEFNSDHGMPGPTIRIYDLRRRVEEPSVTRVTEQFRLP